MDTDNFIVHMKTKDAYANPAEDVEKRFDTSNYAMVDRYQQRKTKKLLD